MTVVGFTTVRDPHATEGIGGECTACRGWGRGIGVVLGLHLVLVQMCWNSFVLRAMRSIKQGKLKGIVVTKIASHLKAYNNSE